MILVDTSVWIDYVHDVEAPHTDALDRALSDNLVVTGDLIMAEFLQGFRTNKEFAEAQDIMERLLCYNLVGKSMAVQSARN
ncbi:hypothetical protein AGMMS49546_09540 [Spirochaetia bacterium]|nr:hypothetical protein AGMMS49546_09540 [Spirochaetia bacterium]